MLGKKFEKPLHDICGYMEASKWCGNNNAFIAEYDNHYAIEGIPEKTLGEILDEAKALQKGLLSETDWYVTRASEPDGAPIPDNVLEYRRRLRELDKDPSWPDVEWPVLDMGEASAPE